MGNLPVLLVTDVTESLVAGKLWDFGWHEVDAARRFGEIEPDFRPMNKCQLRKKYAGSNASKNIQEVLLLEKPDPRLLSLNIP